MTPEQRAEGEEECIRALELAQTIAQDAVARVAEENPNLNGRNASALAVFGFLTGVGQGMIERTMNDGCPAQFVVLFEHAKMLGINVGASPVDIREMMKG